jgi:HD-GYP domain-containing protein (c-di-GMP phosphodiesterase class II)
LPAGWAGASAASPGCASVERSTTSARSRSTRRCSDELARIRRHPEAGASLIGGIKDFRPALPYVLYHHERWDGSGYPHGRSGRSIPLEARLLAVADAFDAMTSPRAYRTAVDVGTALNELERCSGTQFDPFLTEAFVTLWRPQEALVPAAAF